MGDPAGMLIDDPCGHPAIDPGGAGADGAGLVALVERATREVDEGLLPSCQLAVARRGRLVLCRTIGAAPTRRYVTFSCTKAIVAGALWRLLGGGELAPSTRVADVIPAFGANGKEGVTLEHLLTHTAGVPNARFPFADWPDRSRRRAHFAEWAPEWAPGTRFTYHGTSAHWVLADVIEEITGQDFRVHVRRSILDPLGLPALRLGTPVPEQSDVLDVVMVGEAPTLGAGGSTGDAAEIDASAIGTNDADLLAHNDPAMRAVGQPGGGAIGRAADLALLYQAMLADPDGLWDAAVLRAGTAEIHCALDDPMVGVPANRTLGLVVAGDDGHAALRGFGATASPGTFGHMGAGGQVAWADPATGLSFAYLTNGLDRDPYRMGARGFSLSTRAARVALPD